MPDVPAPSVVLFVASVEHVAAFYRGVFAMDVLHVDDDYEVLGVGGLQLVIHRLPGESAPSSDAHGNVPVREDSYAKVCLPVRSIEAARLAAAQLGGRIFASHREWEGRGFLACDGHDPEGNVIQARQSAG